MPELIDVISKKELTDQNATEFQPVFFRLANEEDKSKFEYLLKSNSTLKMFDCFLQQKEELNKINRLKKPLEEKQQEDTSKEALAKEGVWIYYSWLNCIVHALDKEDFITVRTNRNQHKITRNEQDTLRKKRVGVIGLSVGQAIALTLVLERSCGEIRIADFDTLELSNLNRIKTGLYNLGLKKCVQVAREIAELDPYIKVVCYSDGITENNIDDYLTHNGKLDLLIEECDSLDVKILSRIKAKEFEIPVLMETNDRGMIDIERYDLEPEYPMLHNLLGDVSWKGLQNLSNEQKVPMMMKLAAFKKITQRQKLTVLEISQSISTWPQLGSNVVMGAGVTADVARRILLNQLNISGRFYVDVEGIIKNEQPDMPFYTPPILEKLSVENMHRIAGKISSGKTENDAVVSKGIIETIVSDATTAPSSGNDQPWKFLFKENRLFLFNEEERAYSFGNYNNQASYISLGAAIENIVLSAHRHQLEVSVTLFPISDEPICIACFDYKIQADETTENHSHDTLYNFVRERCTNRKITSNEPLSAELITQLQAAAESVESIKSSFVIDKEALHTLGKIISAGDRIRIMHPQGHYDFFNREIRYTAEEVQKKKTGMDIATLELSPQAALALDILRNDEGIQVLREINGLQALKSVSVVNTINSAAMGFIEADSSTPVDFINGGRAMQRQWLAATELGYAYHPMVIPLYLFYRLTSGNGEGLAEKEIEEVNEMRQQFMEIFPGEEKRGEILLFRVFKADEITIRSPRLGLDEILFSD